MMRVPPRRRKFLLTTLFALLTLCLFFAFAYGNSIKKNFEIFFGKRVAVPKVEGISEVAPTENFTCLKNCEATSLLTNYYHSKSIIGTYAEESSRFVCYIKCNESFAYVRWNDGELDTLTGWKSKTRIRMSNMEGWSTEKDTKNQEKLKDDLISSMRIRNAKFWYGFNFPSCAEGLVIQQLSGGGSWKWVSRFSRLDAFPPSEQLTYADLLSGRNYHYFGMKRLLFETARRSNTIIFANRKVKQNKKISWQQRIIPFEADLTGNWLQVRDILLDKATALAKSHASHIFLISLGPISNILIASMWKVNKNNTYIDVGAALNEFHGFGSQGRAYLRNPACQALGPTCTAMRYRLNLNVTSSMDISVRSVNSIDKLRCCTPVLNGCSLKLERWYVPKTKMSDKSKISCKGLLPKQFIESEIKNLCECGEKLGSQREVSNCLSANVSR